MLQLNPQVQQYAGFTPGKRVVGRAPETPIGTAGDLFRNDVMNPETPTVPQTHQVIAKLMGFKKPLCEVALTGNIIKL